MLMTKQEQIDHEQRVHALANEAQARLSAWEATRIERALARRARRGARYRKTLLHDTREEV